MPAFKKTSRPVLVIGVIAVLGAVILRFFYDTDLFYYSLAVAAAITAIAIYFIYRKPRTVPAARPLANPDTTQSSKNQGTSEDSEAVSDQTDFTNNQPTRKQPPIYGSSSTPVKPSGAEVAARYRKMAETVSNPDEPFWKVTPRSVQKLENHPEGLTPEAIDEEPAEEQAPSTSIARPAEKVRPAASKPFNEDETTLTLEEKNELVNAVWYRCENPYCKDTNFLGVHHIIDEKDGGSNKLDNLIVLCPFCHDLAHRGEIPEQEMLEWISDREQRLKFKPNWKYF